MATPGLSLFQGAESMHVNRSREIAEEEEELEDQKRRHAELGNMLQNAFDDLDEEETTMDSTSNIPSDIFDHPQSQALAQQQQNHQHPQQLLHNGALQHDQQQHEVYAREIQQLRTLLESRSNELETLKRMASETNKSRDELQKRLVITEAELDRALAGKTNSHELLVESKEKYSNLESTLTKLRQEKRTIESENNTLLGKLETTQALLADMQRKYDMVERDFHKRDDSNAEQRRKQADERHRAEMEMLKEQLEQLSNKLDKKSHELDNMSTRYHALQSSHDLMLVEKASRINDLSHALNESQQRCEELLAKQDHCQDNLRLQRLVAGQQEQIHGMEKTIAALRERVDMTTAELDVMDSVLLQHNRENGAAAVASSTHLAGGTPLSPVRRIAGLKDELYRALASVKSKRDEVRRQQQQLEERNAELRRLRAEENRALVQITTLKEANIRLENRIRMLEEEYAAAATTTTGGGGGGTHTTTTSTNTTTTSTSAATDNETLKELQKRLDDEVHQLTAAKVELQRQLTTQTAELRRLEALLKNGEVDLEELRQERDSMKRSNDQASQENETLRARLTDESAAGDKARLELEKHKFLLRDAQSECDRLKQLYVDISNTKEAMAYDLQQLRSADVARELQEQRDLVAHLRRGLQLTELKASELSKLLETERLGHERDAAALREQLEQERRRKGGEGVGATKADKKSSNNCTKCMDHLAQATKFEIENLRLSNLNATRKQEIEELRRQLLAAQRQGEELTGRLALGEQQEALIRELKTKAHQFEEYIKGHEQQQQQHQHHASNSSSGCSDVATTARTPPPPPNADSAPPRCDRATSPAPPNTHNNNNNHVKNEAESATSKIDASELQRRLEARIRDEMAKIFAVELKRLQGRYHNTEQAYAQLHREYEQRQYEIGLLKKTILAERAKIAEMLQEKDAECQAMVGEQTTTIKKLREELALRTRRVAEMQHEMDERQQQIEAERQSMKDVMTQWEEQRRQVDAVERQWRQRLEEVQLEHEKAIKSWRLKHESAKDTNLHYKRYMEDKEAHMYKEYDRLKVEYEAAVVQLEVKLRKALERKHHKLKGMPSSTTAAATPQNTVATSNRGSAMTMLAPPPPSMND